MVRCSHTFGSILQVPNSPGWETLIVLFDSGVGLTLYRLGCSQAIACDCSLLSFSSSSYLTRTGEYFEMDRWKQKRSPYSTLKHRLQKVNHITRQGLADPPPLRVYALSKMKAGINRKYYQWMSLRRFDILIPDMLLQPSTVSSNCCRGSSSLRLYCCL